MAQPVTPRHQRPESLLLDVLHGTDTRARTSIYYPGHLATAPLPLENEKLV